MIKVILKTCKRVIDEDENHQLGIKRQLIESFEIVKM